MRKCDALCITLRSSSKITCYITSWIFITSAFIEFRDVNENNLITTTGDNHLLYAILFFLKFKNQKEGSRYSPQSYIPDEISTCVMTAIA
jgi:hypothetical protein